MPTNVKESCDSVSESAWAFPRRPRSTGKSELGCSFAAILAVKRYWINHSELKRDHSSYCWERTKIGLQFRIGNYHKLPCVLVAHWTTLA